MHSGVVVLSGKGEVQVLSAGARGHILMVKSHTEHNTRSRSGGGSVDGGQGGRKGPSHAKSCRKKEVV
jgi:hypothetical protein